MEKPDLVYGTCEYSPETKIVIAKIAMALQADGMKRSDFRKKMEKVKIMIPKTSLDDWIRGIKTNGSPFVDVKQTGSSHLLCNDGWMILSGWFFFFFLGF